MDKESLKISISHIRCRHIVAALYLCVVMTGVSFYLRNGYWDAGDDKYNILINISKIMLPFWMIACVVDILRFRKEGIFPNKIKEIINPGTWVFLFFLFSIISTLTSKYRIQSIYGSLGWHMGLITIAIMILIYIITLDLISNTDMRMTDVIVAYLLTASAAVLIWGILNRYSIFPIHFMGHEEDYISTLGNINWFCGYLCVWSGIGMGLFLIAGTKKKTMAAGVYVWICAMAAVSCGASSAYLFWIATSFVAFLMALSEEKYLKRWAVMEMIKIMSFPCIRIIGAIRPNRMWYSSSWLHEVTYGYKWIVPFVIIMSVCGLVYLKADLISEKKQFWRVASLAIAFTVIGSTILLIIMNNAISGGIWPVRGHAAFTFSSRYGNGRGAIWIATVKLISKMPFFSWFFGVGCDCFSSFAYSVEEVSLYLQKMLGNTVLTNAHNEMLTMLINEGICGLIAYIGIYLSHIRKAISHWKKNGLILGGILSMVGYTAIGTVGFMHVLSTPFIFLVLGIMAGLTNRLSFNTIN